MRDEDWVEGWGSAHASQYPEMKKEKDLKAELWVTIKRLQKAVDYARVRLSDIDRDTLEKIIKDEIY